MAKHWTLQDAKNRFSAVVEAAFKGEPQHVTKRGVDAVVVLSAEEYKRLARLDHAPAKTFKQHLLAFPKLPDDMQDLFDKPDPLPLCINEMDFGG